MTDNAQLLDGLHEFYVTFGSQYRPTNTAHPQGMDANGYFVVEAPDESTARSLTVALFETRWSMLYTSEEWGSMQTTAEIKYWYPLGELGRLRLTHAMRSMMEPAPIQIGDQVVTRYCLTNHGTHEVLAIEGGGALYVIDNQGTTERHVADDLRHVGESW